MHLLLQMSEKKQGSDSVYFTNLLKIWDLESDGIDRKTLLEAGGLSLLQSSGSLPLGYQTEPLPIASRYRTDRITGMPQSTTLQPVASKYRTDETSDMLQFNTHQPVASRYKTDRPTGTLQSNTPRPVASKYRTDETIGTQVCSEHKMETVSLKSAENAAGDTKICADALNSTFEPLNDFGLFGTRSDNDTPQSPGSIHTLRSSGLSQCCPSCDSHNSYGANWCVECGTVLTKSRQAWSSEDRSQADSIHTCTGMTHSNVRRQTASRIGVADSNSRWTLALSPDRSLSESRSACNTSGVCNSTNGSTLVSSPDRKNQSRLTHACDTIHGSPEVRQSYTHSTTIDSHNTAVSVPKMSEIHHVDRKATHPSRRSCNSLESLYSGLSELLLHDDNLRCSCSTVPTDGGGRESSAAVSTCGLQQHGERNSHCDALNHHDNDKHYRMLPKRDQKQQNVTDSPLQENRVADKHLTTETSSHAMMHHPKHALLLNETSSSLLLTGKVLGCKLSPSSDVSGSDRTHVSSKDENMQRSCDSHYVRHWDTSSVYMWRKPSTLASRKSRTLEVSVRLHQHQLAENEMQQLAAETAITDTLPNKNTVTYDCPPNHDALCKQTVNASYTRTPRKTNTYIPPLDMNKIEEDQSTPKLVSCT